MRELRHLAEAGLRPLQAVLAIPLERGSQRIKNRMRCSVDNETLVLADRGGVEIDHSPKCRGVSLDRGELDEIIDRSLGDAAPPPPPQQPAAPVYQPEPQGHRFDDRRRDHDDDGDDYRSGNRKKRKESFLSDIFDF
jgi:hypothetical protein